MKSVVNIVLGMILITSLFYGCMNVAAQDEPRKVKNSRKKEIPRITLKNLSPPYLNFDYFKAHEEFSFQFKATSFSPVNAWWLAEASTLVYADEDFVSTQFGKVGLKEVKFFDRYSTQCFAASNEKFAIVAFRGSEIWKRKGKFDFNKIFADLKADVDIRLTDWPQGGKVHRGFKEALDEVWSDLLVYIRRLSDRGCKIWMTGHSLGAALATLAADRYGDVQGVYTFGSPRVGDNEFEKNFEVRTYRIVNNKDIVALVPPPGRYKHVGNIKFIDGAGDIFDQLIEEADRDSQPRNEFYGSEGSTKRSTSSSPSLIPKSFKDHVPLLYSIHLWNYVVGLQE